MKYYEILEIIQKDVIVDI